MTREDAGLRKGGYRYVLHRDMHRDMWRDNDRRVCFIMLNPSTADAQEDDHTIRRCMGFATTWGYGRLTVVNLFARRATRPRALKLLPNPVGDLNDDVIVVHSSTADLVVCAWGNHGSLHGRGADVVALLRRRGIALHHLGLTKAGEPRHPLRLSGYTKPIPYDSEDEGESP